MLEHVMVTSTTSSFISNQSVVVRIQMILGDVWRHVQCDPVIFLDLTKRKNKLFFTV